MIESLVQQLQDADPALRRRAIHALAELRNPAALSALAEVYRRDPEPELRTMALRAGQFIRQHAPIPAAPSSPEASDAAAEDDALPPITGPVSARDRELARGLLNSATDYHMAGDRVRAIENLGKALSLDPALREQKFVQNLILNVMGGMGLTPAIATLTHPDRRNALIQELGGKRKLTRRQEHGVAAETATWNNVLLDFGLYALMAFAGALAVFIFGLQAFQNLLDNMNLNATAAAASDLDPLLGASLFALVFMALISGLFQAIGLALQGLFVHLAATTILGGDGTLVYLYRRLVPLQTLVLLISTAGLLLVLAVSDIMGLLVLLSLGATVGSLIVFIIIARVVGEVYAFSAWTGCGALVLGGILQAVVFYLGNYVLFGLVSLVLGE